MVIVAFPGMGKSPLAHKDSKYVDLDFGYFRDALGVPKDREDTLIPSFVRYMRKYEDDGFIVLTNNPKLIKYGVDSVYVPAYDSLQYAAKKLQKSEAVIGDWVDNWITEAEKYGVHCRALRTGLDWYLTHPPKRKGGHGCYTKEWERLDKKIQ